MVPKVAGSNPVSHPKARHSAGLSFYMHRTAQLLRWYTASRTAFSVHSPLLYSFCTEVLDDDRCYYAFEPIERQRSLLLESGGSQILTDLAGASLPGPVKLADSISRASSPAWKGQFLFRLAKWWQPDAILEVGTHVGLATSYLAAARKHTPVWTIDQSAQAHTLAGRLWESLALDQIRPITAPACRGLEEVDWSHGRKWLVYLDADHRSSSVEEMLRYLETRLERPFLVVIDDIRWSDDMFAGWSRWHTLRTGAWIDLFQGGLWIADDAFLEPVHMSLIPRKWKPLRLGWI